MGNKFVENFARDIKLEFPNATGYSIRNLKYMAQFARTYTDFEIMQRTVAQIPWRHNIALLDKVKDKEQRDWYTSKVIEHGWSRDVLAHQIETNLFHRQIINEENVYEKRVVPKMSSYAKRKYNYNKKY